MNGYYYDINGTPITVDWWGELYGDKEYRIIGRDTVGKVLVSTVWIGINHAFMPTEPIKIFETMVFPGDNMVEDDEFTARYSTLEEAQAGHARIVAEVAAKYGLPI